MDLFKDYGNFQIHAFWSKDITVLVNQITSHHAKSYATQHNIILTFLNETLFQGEGELNKEFRKRNKTYPDLKVPAKETEKGFEIVELRVHTSQLKYLRYELRIREKTFSNSDYLYYTFFLQAGSKEEGKIIKDRDCIYYLVIIKISKQTLSLPINELVEEIRMGTKDFTKELAEKSGLDVEKEELLGVENMIKVVDLERKLNMKVADLEERDKQLEERDKQLEERDKRLEEKDKEIERLKAQLKDI